MTDYKKRLKISINGATATNFFSPNGVLLATGYNRIVIGERGPYIEFSEKNIVKKEFKVPESEEKRLHSNVFYYDEYRSIDGNIKLYHQKKTVDYADYKIGMYYISPFELKTAEGTIIDHLRTKEKKVKWLKKN